MKIQFHKNNLTIFIIFLKILLNYTLLMCYFKKIEIY